MGPCVDVVFGYGQTGAASEAAPKPPAEDAASGEKRQGLRRRRRRAGRSRRGARAVGKEDAQRGTDRPNPADGVLQRGQTVEAAVKRDSLK